MAEIKGGIFAMIFFVAIILPGILVIGITSLHQHSFMKMTTELTELVKQEGGVTTTVTDRVDSLEARGYTITFTDQYGTPVDSKVSYGSTVVIDFVYEYDGARSTQKNHTENSVVIMRR